MNEYATSNSYYIIRTPQTQAQKLAFNEEQIVASYTAPKRNKHIFGVFSYDEENNFYYSPNYNYGTDSITEVQQVVIINGKEDKYSIFSIEESDDEKALRISYDVSTSGTKDQYSIYSNNEDSLQISYNT